MDITICKYLRTLFIVVLLLYFNVSNYGGCCGKCCCKKNTNSNTVGNPSSKKLLINSQKIDNFDKMHFLLDTTMGFLIIKGDNLDLVKLDTLSGNVTIKGNINSLDYILENKKNKEESVFSRLFK